MRAVDPRLVHQKQDNRCQRGGPDRIANPVSGEGGEQIQIVGRRSRQRYPSRAERGPAQTGQYRAIADQAGELCALLERQAPVGVRGNEAFGNQGLNDCGCRDAGAAGDRALGAGVQHEQREGQR